MQMTAKMYVMRSYDELKLDHYLNNLCDSLYGKPKFNRIRNKVLLYNIDPKVLEYIHYT